MEYTQWENHFKESRKKLLWVLILVVMEYTQWVTTIKYNRYEWNGLNPCCNGIYSMSGGRMGYVQNGCKMS